jgi:thioester reductase-like protein
MATVLVTGASGFVGKFLILALLGKGDTVFALLRQPQTQLATLQQWLQSYGVSAEHLYAVRGDFRQPGTGISADDWQAMAAVTVIYHSGALFAWGLAADEARLVNVDGAIELFTTAAKYLQLARFVQVSGYMLTMAAHLQKLGIVGDGSNTDWSKTYQQVGAYEASKLEAHFAIKRTALALNVPLTVIHPATVIGHSESGEIAPNQEFTRTLHDLLKGKLAAVPGGGGYRLPLVSVDYLTQFMAHVADYPETAGCEYLVADDQTPSLKTALTVCAERAGVSAPRMNVPVPLLQHIVRWQWLGQKLGMTAEMLHFLRTEKLDTSATTYMANKMGVKQAKLAVALAQTMSYVLAQPA